MKSKTELRVVKCQDFFHLDQLAKRDGAKVVAPYPWKVQTCANHDPKVLYDDVGFTTQKSNFAM